MPARVTIVQNSVYTNSGCEVAFQVISAIGVSALSLWSDIALVGPMAGSLLSVCRANGLAAIGNFATGK